MRREVTMLTLALLALVALPVVALAGETQPEQFIGGGEWAAPKKVPYQDPPPSVLWGPARVSDLVGLQWGLYGLGYNGLNDKLNAVYFWQSVFHRYRSSDSTNPMMKDTIAVTTLPGPVNDSFQDLAYCRYDNSLWVHSSKYKRVYKVDAAGGGVTRQFQSPATQYPTGLAFDERHKKLYIVDRMGEGVFPCSIYVMDTMGTVLQRAGLPQLGYSYAGARCMDIDYSTTNPNMPTLLMVYTYFSASGILDSVYLFELDRNDFHVINRAKLPNLGGYVNNSRGVAWDPRSGDYWIGIMQNPDHYIYKMDGWHNLLSSDVGITGMPAPRATYNIGDTVRLRVTARNYDTLQSRTFPATMYFNGYSQTRTKTLGPGREDTINFGVWLASPGGSYVARCSLGLVGDAFPANDTWTEPFEVIGIDVGCTRILAPGPFANPGDTISPACSTYNYGTTSASYSVRMQIGSFYDQLGQVLVHEPGTARYVTFPAEDWVVGTNQGGIHTVACSTRLGTDTYNANDKLTDTVIVRVPFDAGVHRLLEPVGQVDSGAVVTPACTVENYGTMTASYGVRMKIGTGYSEVTQVTAQPSGERWEVTFPPTVLTQRGWHAVACSTEFGLDSTNWNDYKRDSVFVAIRDIGIVRVIAPIDTVPDSTWLHPECMVRNFGNTNEPVIPVSFRIGAWADVETVFGLAPGGFTSVVMSDSLYSSPGVWLDRAELLISDLTPANNIKLDTFWVLGTVAHDVAATAVLAPSGSFDTATVVAPRGVVTNNGAGAETFWTFFRCVNTATGTTEYLDSVQVSGLAPGTFDTVDFTADNFPVPGPYSARCSTWLAGDQNSTNDLATGSFTVTAQTADIGVLAIVEPTGTIDTMTTVTPRARWRNYATVPAGFRAWFILANPAGSRVYTRFVDVAAVPAGTDTVIAFPTHNVGMDTGAWTARCSTFAGGDPNPANDVLQARFFVAAGPQWPAGWHEMATIPVAPSGKAVKDGGWAAIMAGNRIIYLAKGNKTADFYSYDPVNNRWTTNSPIPTGIENKLSKKGAIGTADGNRYVYFTKGNNTAGFWRYDTQRDSFRQMADVPYGLSNKKVKGGTDLVYIASDSGDYIYLLKGYKCEFYRFDVANERWETLQEAPVGAKPKYDKGSWLVYDEGTLLYAHKAKYHEFYTYDLATRTWNSQSLVGMPRPSGYTGRSKKSKDGGSGAYFNGAVWALKGGNTQEWWRYDIAANAWTEFETLPAYGTTGKKKRVKAGADLVSYGNGGFFTAKGNKTLEFWRYFQAPTAFAPAPRAGVQGAPVEVAGRVTLAPNPMVSGRTTLHYVLPVAGPAAVRVFDAAGRVVTRRELVAGRTGKVDLDLRGLSAGVYLVRFDSERCSSTAKVVIEQ
ncbi:MAG: T9SS type A sorting domain-containing protein [bacterium]